MEITTKSLRIVMRTQPAGTKSSTNMSFHVIHRWYRYGSLVFSSGTPHRWVSDTSKNEHTGKSPSKDHLQELFSRKEIRFALFP